MNSQVKRMLKLNDQINIYVNNTPVKLNSEVKRRLELNDETDTVSVFNYYNNRFLCSLAFSFF